MCFTCADMRYSVIRNADVSYSDIPPRSIIRWTIIRQQRSHDRARQVTPAINLAAYGFVIPSDFTGFTVAREELSRSRERPRMSDNPATFGIRNEPVIVSAIWPLHPGKPAARIFDRFLPPCAENTRESHPRERESEVVSAVAAG